MNGKGLKQILIDGERFKSFFDLLEHKFGGKVKVFREHLGGNMLLEGSVHNMRKVEHFLGKEKMSYTGMRKKPSGEVIEFESLFDGKNRWLEATLPNKQVVSVGYKNNGVVNGNIKQTNGVYTHFKGRHGITPLLHI